MKNRPVPSATPEASNAIRVQFDEDEPAAVVFSDSAQPGALVSWAWCQLIALDTLLACASGTRRTAHEEDVAGAVRSVLVPVINALVFSELRAEELRLVGERSDVPPMRGRRGRKTKVRRS